MLTVYFDGACPLCRAEIDHYRRQRGADALRFVDASSDAADLGTGLSRDEALARFHVRTDRGALTLGAAAFVAIWQVLPRWRWAARLASLPGVSGCLEAAYRAFLPLRAHISRALRTRKRVSLKKQAAR